MKGGGILGGIGGLLGVGLLSRGAMRGGASLLGTLVNGMAGCGHGGTGKGRGGQSLLLNDMGGGRGKRRERGGTGDDSTLADVLQQALFWPCRVRRAGTAAISS